MDTWLIVVLVVAAVLLLLAIGGAIATSRRAKAQEPQLLADLAAVNDALAAAHAADKGWDPERLRTAAESAFAERHPGVEPEALTLVQVDDRPGIAEDRAVFRVVAAGAEHDLVLGRSADGWVTVEA
jgi:type II secretory pathway pseudopilin PulG